MVENCFETLSFLNCPLYSLASKSLSSSVNSLDQVIAAEGNLNLKSKFFRKSKCLVIFMKICIFIFQVSPQLNLQIPLPPKMTTL